MTGRRKPGSPTRAFEQYVQRAQRYAWKQWLLDDPAMVRDWCVQSWRHHATPSALVDAYAEKYDLTNPHED